MDEIRQLTPRDSALLLDLFNDFSSCETHQTFHPHAFDSSSAQAICGKRGKDYYSIGLLSGRAVAYGILRGWDEGFVVPSLGVAVHSQFKGLGLGSKMMGHLTHVARQKGATQIRLKVYKNNENAIALYKRLGYSLKALNEREYLGTIDLERSG